MAKKGNNALVSLLDSYQKVFEKKYAANTLSSDRSRVVQIEKSLQSKGMSIINIVNAAMATDDPYGYAMDEFDDAVSSGVITCKTTKVLASWKKAYKKIILFILGQYDADLYLALESKHTELEFCKLVARHALFCTVSVADGVKNGIYGSGLNKGKGNSQYSWFYCIYQRKKGNSQKRGNQALGPTTGAPILYRGQQVYYDDNTQAGLAIKNAVDLGLPMRITGAKFTGYMACHLWDESCHNHLYHTSVVNLVLLPKAIGGLSDYSVAVKRLLQFEAAMRFGVYVGPYNSLNTFSSIRKPKYYSDVNDLWRQPQEHDIALKNISSKTLPTPIQENVTPQPKKNERRN